MEKKNYRVTKKLSGVQKTFRKWSDWSLGDIVIGKLSGWHEDDYDHQCAMVDVEDAFFKKEKEAKDVKGRCLVLNNCGMVNKALEGVKEGTLIQVEYKGTNVIEKGKYAGKEAHAVEVSLLEDQDSADTSADEEDEMF